MLWPVFAPPAHLVEALPDGWDRLVLPLVGGGGLLEPLQGKGWKQPAGRLPEVYLSDPDPDVVALWRALLLEPRAVFEQAEEWLFVVDGQANHADRAGALDCLKESWLYEADRGPGTQLVLRNRLRRWPSSSAFLRAAPRWPRVDLARTAELVQALRRLPVEVYDGGHYALPRPRGPRDVLAAQVSAQYSTSKVDAFLVHAWTWYSEGGTVVLDLPNAPVTTRQVDLCWSAGECAPLCMNDARIVYRATPQHRDSLRETRP
jgi:hypothetical protein